MRPRQLLIAALIGLAIVVSAATTAPIDTSSLKQGTPDLKSAGPIAFAPDGVLFMGDPQSQAIFAIDTGDRTSTGKSHVKVSGIDGRIAGLLGTQSTEIEIRDVTVNPTSGNIFLSVARGRGPQAPPVLLKLDRKGEITEVPLKDVKFAKATLTDPAQPKAGGAPGRGMRAPAITGLAYIDGKVYVAGLSNEQFDSTFRVIPFPFASTSKGTNVEIYHGNHGKLETNSPIRSFTKYDIAGDAHLLAAYTCTPLVKIPLKDLTPGAKIKGVTVAELGNRNTPLDMVVYNKDGKDYLLMINDNRGVMKIDLATVGSVKGIAERVGGTAGLPYETIKDLTGVVQMSQLDAGHALILVRGQDGKHNLETIHLP